MTDYTPVYTGGVKPMSKTLSAAGTGGQVVEVTTASAVAPTSGASAKCVGVLGPDTASGGRGTVWPLANCEHEVTASGTIAVGDGVVSAAAGAVATATIATAAAAGTLLGIATTAATNGLKVRFIGRG